MSQREIVFRCRACGAAAPLEITHCQHCGLRFETVLCSRCGCEGDERDFADGCPQCGYLYLGNKRSSKQLRSAWSISSWQLLLFAALCFALVMAFLALFLG